MPATPVAPTSHALPAAVAAPPGTPAGAGALAGGRRTRPTDLCDLHSPGGKEDSRKRATKAPSPRIKVATRSASDPATHLPGPVEKSGRGEMEGGGPAPQVPLSPQEPDAPKRVAGRSHFPPRQQARHPPSHEDAERQSQPSPAAEGERRSLQPVPSDWGWLPPVRTLL